MRAVRALVAVLLLVGLAACQPRSTPAPSAGASAAAAAPMTAAATHELGRQIYNFRCYFCHGYSGNAQTLAATYLNPRPRDFTATAPADLSRERMLDAITNGRPGSAMRGFAGILTPAELAAVTDFVRQEFMVAKAPNTRYHTPENGWPNHERYREAFPFATGQLTLDTPAEQLDASQRRGRELFMGTCISCHDRARVKDPGPPWDARPLSYPRPGFQPGDAPAGADLTPRQPVDAVTSATPYHLHDRRPVLANATPQLRRGETLYQNNCAFCHAGDGTGRNWIGTFLEPHARDLTSDAAMQHMTPSRLRRTIREGLPGTSMPAWQSVLSDADIGAVVAYIDRAFHPLAPEPVPAR